MKPHKHAELIKAWADGAEIEYLFGEYGWTSASRPTWDEKNVYRIKPEPKPDYEDTVTLFCNCAVNLITPDVEPRWPTKGAYYKSFGDFKITWCGETGKIKKVQIL